MHAMSLTVCQAEIDKKLRPIFKKKKNFTTPSLRYDKFIRPALSVNLCLGPLYKYGHLQP